MYDNTYIREILSILEEWYSSWQTFVGTIDWSSMMAHLDRIAFYTEGLLVLLIVYMFGRIYRG